MRLHLQLSMKLCSLLRMHGRLLLGGCDAGDKGLLVDAVLRGGLAAADALRDELAVHLDMMQAASLGTPLTQVQPLMLVQHLARVCTDIHMGEPCISAGQDDEDSGLPAACRHIWCSSPSALLACVAGPKSSTRGVLRKHTSSRLCTSATRALMASCCLSNSIARLSISFRYSALSACR